MFQTGQSAFLVSAIIISKKSSHVNVFIFQNDVFISFLNVYFLVLHVFILHLFKKQQNKLLTYPA